MSHLIQEPQAAHHQRCQDQCGVTEGPMLKCMNPKARNNVPCNNIIHVSCSDIPNEHAQYLATFYCTDCSVGNESLHEVLEKAEKEAKAKYELEVKARSVKPSVSREEYDKLKSIAADLNVKLREKISESETQAAQNEEMRKQIQQLVAAGTKREKEFEDLTKRVHELESNGRRHGTWDQQDVFKLSPRSMYNCFEETLHQADGAPKDRDPGDFSKPTTSATYIASSTFNSEPGNHITWPDYEKQAAAATKEGEQTLMLVRASLAKPQPFAGDVTRWSTFLSEFIRTSARGHYRDFEDMDRLRELIKEEAYEMFVAELCDPGAETLATLKRLNEFFGVKGNAVRVSLDRITQMSKVDKPTQKETIMKLYTNIKNYMMQCRVHGQEHELASQATVYIIESKMCSEFTYGWRQWAKNNGRPENLEAITMYLEDQIRELNLRSVKQPKNSVKANVHVTSEATGGPASAESSAAQRCDDQSYGSGRRGGKGGRGNKAKGAKRYANSLCFLCKQKHPFYLCEQFLDSDIAKRNEIVNRLHICTRCLCNDTHTPEKCHNKLLRCIVPGCRIENRHYKLHDHRQTHSSALNHINCVEEKQVSHFAMAPGHVIARDGTRTATTVMWDIGAGISLATNEIFEATQAETKLEYDLTLHWATDVTHQESCAKLFDVRFVPHGSDKVIKIEGITAVSELNLPEQYQDADELKKTYPHLAKVPLPSYEKSRPQILLGLPHNGLMLPISCVRGSKIDEPAALLTRLGWVVLGSRKEADLCRPILQSRFVNMICCEKRENETSDDMLLHYVHRFNQLESIGVAHVDASLDSKDDQTAALAIQRTMQFRPDAKRYEVGLLWQKDDDVMIDNYSEAVIRLQSTEKRLIKLSMVDFVNKQFEQQIAEGLLVEVSREQADTFPRRNYVYGFLTFNHNKDPPKPRWVNDTAARYKGVSLNSKLLKGPDSLVPLPLAMCALREGKIAFQADVKSMFNQVLLREEDQYSQLTLWRNCLLNEAPRIFRQTRVIFGPTCSPAVTSAVRIHHARACASEFPEAAAVAENQMYVDDVPESCDTVEEAAKVANDLITMFERINWPLVEFQSNSQEFLNRLPAANVSQKTSGMVSNDEDEYITKILGIFWKPREDVYIFRLNDDTIVRKCLEQGYTPTKKEMLGIIMRFFDPTGMISPFRIRGHMIMQRVWKAGTDWRMKPPKEISNSFIDWLREFASVARLEIPRPYASWPLKDCRLTLHVFVDAGAEAFAACAYLRIEHGSEIQVRLVASKARVAPVKYVSIPRLELMSALIGARLLTTVKRWHRRLKIEDYICWTDSDVVFKWIRATHLPRTAFTAPRIAEIQELTSTDRWFHVPSLQNVADYATKHRAMDYSDATHEWYTGPRFLYGPQSGWPTQTKEISYPIDAITLIIKPLVSAKPLLAGVMTQISAHIRGKWYSHVMVVAKALRFADYLLPQRPQLRRTGQITGYEFHRAENYIIGMVQRAVFPAEYESLRTGKRVLTSSTIASFSPIWCSRTNLIRATTRLSETFPYDMRRPPILPCFSETTDAIVDHYHQTHMHVGDNAIISSLRSRVWVINARRAARRCRARCLKCVEVSKKARIPNRADLPDFRFDIVEKPFFHTGMDLFGPFSVYVGRSRHMREIHVVIFTCMVTRAVYLETLEDQSTESFLVAFNKLWARRGPIAHVYSDNGRNFLGASEWLRADPFQKWLAEKQMRWHFIPALTPQFGGAWERLIKDIKRGMHASFGRFTVPRQSFEHILARIELNVNNRPLTQLPVTTEEEAPITPYLLLSGYPNYPVCDESAGPAINDDTNLLKMKSAGRVNAIVQAFRSRFVREYAPVIARRNQKTKETAHKLIKADDLVVYMDPTKNPSQWVRGIVAKTYPGRDKKVRVADVKLKTGEIIPRRSVYRLAKIDLRRESPNAEQAKYSAALNTLSAAAHFEFSNQNKSESDTMKKISSEISTLPKPKEAGRVSVQLSDKQREEFLDSDGSRSIYIKNLPPTLGLTEILEIFTQFGEIKTIAVTKWTGVSAFNATVCYTEPASVSSSTMYSESIVIFINGRGYRQTIEKMGKPFSYKNACKHPLFTFLKMKDEAGNEDKVLTITEGKIRDDDGRAKIPEQSNDTGFVHCCNRARRYTFNTIDVEETRRVEIMASLPTVPKDEAQQALNVVLAGPANDQRVNPPNREVRMVGDAIQVRVQIPNPFNEEREIGERQGQRHVIESRREAGRLRSVIVRPPRT